VQTITIPGPGLVYKNAVSGAVNHRGDIPEEINESEVRSVLRENRADCLCIAGKFSIRNPALEERVREIALDYYPGNRIAVSHYLGEPGFPARIAGTEINARIGEIVTRMTRDIRRYAGNFYYFKGDGGLADPKPVMKNPSLLYNSSPAAVALGARYLSGEENCLVIDIGGTTTDLVVLKGGSPEMEDIYADGLCPKREGNALAFGGKKPTLTDALNRTGWSIGDKRRSAVLDITMAETAVQRYTDSLFKAVREERPGVIVGTGFLAPYLLPEIEKMTGIRVKIPKNSSCANAVGVAVSKVSLALHVRADTGRGVIVINGEPKRRDVPETDNELVALCMDELRRRALKSGAPEEEISETETLLTFFNAYDVVRSGRRAERISDLIVSIKPGITVEAP